jgi:diacylglycerol O-acyltransferase / wax synthase
VERMNALDATFLAVEDAVDHMHIGSVEVFEGPAPRYEEVRDAIAAKLPLVPRYRQKVVTAPGSIGRPLWVDDPHFRLDFHLRHAALPPPGGDDELRRFVGRVMSQQLDRRKPLWENWMVEGLADGTWLLVTKVHHCMVDGIAGSDLVSVVLSREAEPERAPVDVWAPAPEPSTVQLALRSVLGLAVAPIAVARSAVGWLVHPGDASARTVNVMRGLVPMARVLPPAPPSVLTGPIGPHRRWDFTRAALSDVKEVRAALGGTVNDVVLAVVARGLRDLLLASGEPVDARVVRTLVPVSVRQPDARGVFDNRVSSMFATLPVGIADPVERLAAVRRQLAELKASKEADAGEAVISLAEFTPPIVHAIAARLVVHRQRNIETVATNVPGPQFPLYLAGRRMIGAYPYVPLLGNVRVGIAIWSYFGTLYFGVTGDDDAAPEIHVVCTGIDEGLRELLKAAAATPTP